MFHVWNTNSYIFFSFSFFFFINQCTPYNDWSTSTRNAQVFFVVFFFFFFFFFFVLLLLLFFVVVVVVVVVVVAGDQEVAGSTPAEVGNILSWRLIMKYFLRPFSPFRWFKKGICQFLAEECAQYWLTAYSIVHILPPETDNCPSWISGRERMTVCTILVNRLED